MKLPQNKQPRSCVLVTGGCGFIGTNYILREIERRNVKIVNLDKCAYSANPQNLAAAEKTDRYTLVQGDICDIDLMGDLLNDVRPAAIVHFAAESHVDRSISGPEIFVQTNMVGTSRLLEATRRHWSKLGAEEQSSFRFLHVSTDEVFGSLGADDPAFTEETPYAPNSPYSASKAASDHMVRAYHHTYGLPTLVTNCSNNYGPFQFPEKLIPLMIRNAMAGLKLPIYGDGLNVRDWLYVGDHCDAIATVLDRGRCGETYNIGGHAERTNRQVVEIVCRLLDERAPLGHGKWYSDQVAFVTDRLGHDRRYAVNTEKIERELGWKPTVSFEQGMSETVQWYLDQRAWVSSVTTGEYRNWISRQYESLQTA